MSNNAAEIFTMAAAIKSARENGASCLVLIGDSQVALKWANVMVGNREPTKLGNVSPVFRESIAELRECLAGMTDLQTRWQPRLRSFSTFGH
jgi:ribonuclease HI